MIVYEPPRVADHVPVIDLGAAAGFTDASQIAAAAEIARAARDIGFFYVIDHGVPTDLMAGELAAAQAFFALPAAAKAAIGIGHSPAMRGYEPLGLQTLDEGSPPDLKESLILGRDLGPDHPWVRDKVPFEGTNQWPDLPGFRDQALAYLEAVMALGRRLGSLVAVSLDLPADHFAAALAEPSCSTRMLRYPPQAAVTDNQIGCGAHTDWGFLTILLQDDAGGLEVQNLARDWILAPPIPGSFIVNLGDMMPRLTNGRYRSTPHRVLNNISGRDRHSVAAFFNPPYAYSFTTLATCLPEGATPPPATTMGAHIQDMFERTYGTAA